VYFNIVINATTSEYWENRVLLHTINHVLVRFYYVDDLARVFIPKKDMPTITARNDIFISPKIALFYLSEK
jgi:hypothetical protein